MKLYSDCLSHPKYNAQRNLDGRTHYVDDDTLRFHKSRILKAKASYNGLYFYLIESCAADSNNTRRVFRGVVFDVFGTVVSRPRLDEGLKTRKQAETAMWEDINKIDWYKHTNDAIKQQSVRASREYANDRKELQALKKKGIV